MTFSGSLVLPITVIDFRCVVETHNRIVAEVGFTLTVKPTYGVMFVKVC